MLCMFLKECLYRLVIRKNFYDVKSFGFMQESFKDFRYGAQDSFLWKIRSNILMEFVNFISKSLRCSLGGSLSLFL